MIMGLVCEVIVLLLAVIGVGLKGSRENRRGVCCEYTVWHLTGAFATA